MLSALFEGSVWECVKAVAKGLFLTHPLFSRWLWLFCQCGSACVGKGRRPCLLNVCAGICQHHAWRFTLGQLVT